MSTPDFLRDREAVRAERRPASNTSSLRFAGIGARNAAAPRGGRHAIFQSGEKMPLVDGSSTPEGSGPSWRDTVFAFTRRAGRSPSGSATRRLPGQTGC